jgi:RimJ/RimL family protein N-acetyltransferase
MVSLFPKVLPSLDSGDVSLRCLIPEHRDSLLRAMQDPEIWKDHSWTNQWEVEIANRWIDTALNMGRTYVIFKDRTIVGSSRFYDVRERDVSIGYSFLARSEWGSGTNGIVKSLMINLAHKYFDQILFKVDERNLRSRQALMKLGAMEVSEIPNDKQRSDGSWRKTVVYTLGK